jgi:hypothetical protein
VPATSGGLHQLHLIAPQATGRAALLIHCPDATADAEEACRGGARRSFGGAHVSLPLFAVCSPLSPTPPSSRVLLSMCTMRTHAPEEQAARTLLASAAGNTRSPDSRLLRPAHSPPPATTPPLPLHHSRPLLTVRRGDSEAGSGARREGPPLSSSISCVIAVRAPERHNECTARCVTVTENWEKDTELGRSEGMNKGPQRVKFHSKLATPVASAPSSSITS